MMFRYRGQPWLPAPTTKTPPPSVYPVKHPPMLPQHGTPRPHPPPLVRPPAPNVPTTEPWAWGELYGIRGLHVVLPKLMVTKGGTTTNHGHGNGRMGQTYPTRGWNPNCGRICTRWRIGHRQGLHLTQFLIRMYCNFPIKRSIVPTFLIHPECPCLQENWRIWGFVQRVRRNPQVYCVCG